MDYQSNNNHHNPFDRRPILKSKAPAVQWVKEWVPQEVVSTGGKCLVLKWVKMDVLKELKKPEEPEPEEQEPEETTEVLFLCSFEGCGKTFTDAGALRKHSHIHGERQYICHYEGCGKKFLDSSKLKRHFLIHTGERHFVCPHAGCGKAFSLDFNLRAHMRTHSQENYHICPYQDCGKRYAHEYKLKTHIKSHHEKHPTMDMMKRTPTSEKTPSAPKPPAVVYGSASSDRPYACPYEGCEKAYIHEYKLNLHLRREHPGHNMEGNGKHTTEVDNDMDEGSVQDAYSRKSSGKFPKLSKPQDPKMSQSKPIQRKGSSVSPANLNVMKQQWPGKDVYDGEDSEETEEDHDDDSSDDSDDEETEDEE
ncbi:Zinc finger transcription factor yy1 [Thalictrum thalictroides]|uniref:Zinc finger transcription factor yy1 n=1 Tax=Thalictrum thalictroides TaxID=46969 RepID=A0A7J6W940_THATH|nr:Zinc finger transcription factor yy1 [Thalictrum thalictroides]